ncbi:hypothetical protein DTO013E5_5980 [Penicillium roqueforti]|uniref:Genomic scaffold, ProqFM164S01 n=1 Tax=Penicillium roqueforti (strain FM164) TaxID=1365484 RepID=W6PZ59_PENRF|nr:uncharacterized protein LCP9604111_5410 [Penicillium roqueforti]CDM29290.1 unnamed protein product [Penicillium roqueforti FM164]KAF9248155.1 hypothetical protein LCP9604111_5410 [Penicillium roqueforti]KAI1836012.1 hypothetical protein CBS147337_3161 [Penicillium roqueforti]KAI2678400.1 hypothetical protein LCP963914a_7831 [Penicillium roqueforti]KAI2683034.1 hypothetical protein CBS147355_2174 [Penicillium roqueforti]
MTAGAISLAELMSHHRDLLVQPICWTSRHLDMLGCQFEHFDHVPPDDIEPDLDPCQPIDHEQKLEERSRGTPEELFEGSSILSRPFGLSFLIWPLLNRRCETPYFFFANKRIHRPLYEVFYRCRKLSQPASQAPRPIVGYLDYCRVERYRGEMFIPRTPKHGGDNRPGWRIQMKRVAQITPKNWSEDPYLLCVLLSLAQLQEYHRKEWHPPIHISRLILTTKPGDKFFHIFEAHITSELLGMLDNPNTARKHIDWPTIKHKKVLFRPLDSLAERLQAEITLNQPPGTFDISDPANPNDIKKEEEDVIHIQRTKEVERKTRKRAKKESFVRSETRVS